MDIGISDFDFSPKEKKEGSLLCVPKKKILVIAGPTAVGKTALSIEMAKAIDGEIISADSMQVYRGMDIGTAKATLEQRKEVPHHMIDAQRVPCPLERTRPRRPFPTSRLAGVG